jgi:hypothetical protein
MMFLFFFVREKNLNPLVSESGLICWERWKRTVIDKQIITCYGAERYLRSGKKIFLDQSGKEPFPLEFKKDKVNIYKIIIAHGAEHACKEMSQDNINGSLAISYCDSKIFDKPFCITLSRENPIHILDSFNIGIILQELDTICDFRWYLEEKENAIKKYSILAYCGEEDLLAHYFQHFDENNNKHYIGTLDTSINGLLVEEGSWDEFKKSKQYLAKKDADKISYFWDELIQRTTQNALDGSLLGNDDIFNGKNAIIEMAKEPRFYRRFISEIMIKSMESFPDPADKIIKKVTFVPSFFKNKAYILLQLYTPYSYKNFNKVREIRQKLLAIACGVLKNKQPQFDIIIGIAIYPPMYEDRINSNPEDFLYLDCSEWNKECISYYEEQNKYLHFFETDNLKIYKGSYREFPEV